MFDRHAERFVRVFTVILNGWYAPQAVYALVKFVLGFVGLGKVYVNRVGPIKPGPFQDVDNLSHAVDYL